MRILLAEDEVSIARALKLMLEKNQYTVLYEVGGSKFNLVFQEGAPPRGSGFPFSGEAPYMIRFFAVYYGESGELLDINQDYIASVSENEALSFADHVLEAGKEQGFYGGYRYLMKTSGGETTVIFLNAERELYAVRDLFISTLLIAVICLVVVFLLVMLLAKRAVAPYMRNLEMQKQFITNAGHELKTPLTAISTSADVLAMEHRDDEWVQNIQVQSGRLSKLIANLITLSRLDEGAPLSGKERIFTQRCTVGNSGFLHPADTCKGQNLFPKY